MYSRKCKDKIYPHSDRAEASKRWSRYSLIERITCSSNSAVRTGAAASNDTFNHAGYNVNQSAKSNSTKDSNVSSNEDAVHTAANAVAAGGRGAAAAVGGETRTPSVCGKNQSAPSLQYKPKAKVPAMQPKDSDTVDMQPRLSAVSMKARESMNILPTESKARDSLNLQPTDSRPNTPGSRKVSKSKIGAKIKERMSATRAVLTTSAQQLKLKLKQASATHTDGGNMESQRPAEREPTPKRVSIIPDQNEMIEPDSVSHGHQSNMIIPESVTRTPTLLYKPREPAAAEDNMTVMSFEPPDAESRRDTAITTMTKRTIPDDDTIYDTEDKTVTDIPIIMKEGKLSASSVAPDREMPPSVGFKRDTIISMVRSSGEVRQISPKTSPSRQKTPDQGTLGIPSKVSSLGTASSTEVQQSSAAPQSSKLATGSDKTESGSSSFVTMELEVEETWSVKPGPRPKEQAEVQKPSSTLNVGLPITPTASTSQPAFPQLPLPPINIGKSDASSKTSVTPSAQIPAADSDLANLMKQADAMSAFYSSLLAPNAPPIGGLDLSTLFPGFSLPIVPLAPAPPPPPPPPKSDLGAELQALMKQSEDLQRQLAELQATPTLIARPPPPPAVTKGRGRRKSCGHSATCFCSAAYVNLLIR